MFLQESFQSNIWERATVYSFLFNVVDQTLQKDQQWKLFGRKFQKIKQENLLLLIQQQLQFNK